MAKESQLMDFVVLEIVQDKGIDRREEFWDTAIRQSMEAQGRKEDNAVTGIREKCFRLAPERGTLLVIIRGVNTKQLLHCLHFLHKNVCVFSCNSNAH
jgi:hypothetical protein